MLNVLNISHTDLDGIASAEILRSGFVGQGYTVDTVYANYDDIDQYVRKAEGYDLVVFTDIMPPAIDMWLDITNVKLIVIDHHKTALEITHTIKSPYLEHYIDASGAHCGASLVYWYLTEHCGYDVAAGCELLAELTRDWDLFLHRDVRSRVLGMAADALGPKRMAEELRHVLSDKHLRGSFTRSIVDAHQIAEDRYNDSVDLAECSLSRYQYYHAKSGLIVPFFVVLTCGYTGLVCNYILKMNGGNGVILAFDMIRRTFSFRTDRDDIDLSELARSLGGGGHRQAAGFTSEQLSNVVLQSTERFGTELSKHLNAAFAGKLV